MRRKPILICSYLLTSVLCLSVFGYSQSSQVFVKPEEDALSQIASERRARLVERLELYFGSLSKGEFSSIYEFMPDACRAGLGKDEWLRQVRHESPGRIQRFIIEEVYAGDYTAPESLRGEKWIARGCGTYLNGIESTKYRAAARVVWLDGEWYVCGSGIAIEGADNQYVRCPGAASNKGMRPTANSAALIEN